jgi:hypothetical protein
MDKIKLLLRRQILHYLLLLLLLAFMIIIMQREGYASGELLDIDTLTWFRLAVIIAVVHQTYVWVCWRLELFYSVITDLFGKKGFDYYCVGFFVLMLSRLAVVLILAWSNSSSLSWNRFLLYGIALVLSIPAVYTYYSVVRYFGITRAAGIDHFDASFQSTPFVKEGIFKFFSNPMYLFGVLVIWLPVLLFSSKAALLAALFNHLYVWVHYLCTEKPDIVFLYSGAERESR